MTSILSASTRLNLVKKLLRMVQPGQSTNKINSNITIQSSDALVFDALLKAAQCLHSATRKLRDICEAKSCFGESTCQQATVQSSTEQDLEPPPRTPLPQHSDTVNSTSQYSGSSDCAEEENIADADASGDNEAVDTLFSILEQPLMLVTSEATEANLLDMAVLDGVEELLSMMEQ